MISGQAIINNKNYNNAPSANIAAEDNIIRIKAENKKSVIGMQGHHRNTNIDILARKRQWEQDKRGTLISADASRLYQTSNKINNEIDKRL